MSKKPEDTAAFIGSGNVFKDFGDPNPEESQAKADLSRQIRKIIEQRKFTQKEAAEIMGIDQPKVSDIIRGKLSKYTIDRLIRFLRLLGTDIEINFKKHDRRSGSTGTLVVGVANQRRADSHASA